MNVLEKYAITEGSREEEALEPSQDNIREPIVSHEEVKVSAKAQAARDKAAEEKILAELFDEDGGIEESEYPRVTAELIERVDYETLRGVFDEMRRRAGAFGKSGFCGPERITPDTTLGGGVYNFHAGINIGTNPLSRSRRGSGRISRVEFQNEKLNIIIHEETHASSENFNEAVTGGKKFLTVVKSFFKQQDQHVVSGYQRNQFENGRVETKFLDFNEGVTDKIAEEVYGEYLKRTGDIALVSDDKHKAGYHVEAYLGSRVVVTAFVEIIATSTGLPSDTVWGALKQGYFTGIDLRQTELQQALEEVFSDGFADRLSEWGAGEQGKIHPEMLEKAANLDLTERSRQRVSSAFKRYQVSLEKRSRHPRGI